jgi:hypothetical protein
MVSSYIGTQIRTTTIQNSYIEFIQEEDIDLTPNINISDKNSPVQALGSYTFQYNLTYMYVIAVEDQPLPTKEFGFDLSFNNSNFNELLEWAMDLDRHFSRWDFRYSNIEIVMDSKNYYYIITSKRLFFDRQISNDSTINCNITCSVDQGELTPDIIDFQMKLVFLEDHSDTIIRGHRELIVIANDVDYALWLGIASILVVLNSLVFILKYPDLDIS